MRLRGCASVFTRPMMMMLRAGLLEYCVAAMLTLCLKMMTAHAAATTDHDHARHDDRNAAAVAACRTHVVRVLCVCACSCTNCVIVITTRHDDDRRRRNKTPSSRPASIQRSTARRGRRVVVRHCRRRRCGCKILLDAYDDAPRKHACGCCVCAVCVSVSAKKCALQQFSERFLCDVDCMCVCVSATAAAASAALACRFVRVCVCCTKRLGWHKVKSIRRLRAFMSGSGASAAAANGI